MRDERDLYDHLVLNSDCKYEASKVHKELVNWNHWTFLDLILVAF